jgi:CubicO group peptidase (beta-lactamase class C family)
MICDLPQAPACDDLRLRPRGPAFGARTHPQGRVGGCPCTPSLAGGSRAPRNGAPAAAGAHRLVLTVALTLALLAALAHTPGLAGQQGAGASPPQPGFQDPDPEALARALRQDLASSAATGAVLVLVDAEGVRRVEALGFRDLAGEDPMPPSYGFHLGTFGDLLLASLALRLSEEGTLDLSRPLGRILPGLTPRIGVLTPEALLLHTAGLDASSLVAAPPGERAPRITPQEALARLRDGVFMAPAGWIRSPSPHHRLLLGTTVEAAAGESLGHLLARIVQEPLGLTGMVVSEPGTIPRGAEPGFQVSTTAQAPYVPAPFAEPGVLQPQERIWTTGSDLGRIVASWLADPAHLDALARPRVPDPALPSGMAAHGMGFRVDAEGGWTASGGGPGHGVWLRIFPERGEAVLLLTNGGGSLLPRTRGVLEAWILSRPEPPPGAVAPELLALASAPVPTWEDQGLVPVEVPELSLAGTYRNGSQAVRLAVQGDALVVDTGLPTPLALRPGAEGTLEAHLEDGRTAMVLRILRTRTGVPFLLYQGVAHRREEG